jgi:hypothetical protein
VITIGNPLRTMFHATAEDAPMPERQANPGGTVVTIIVLGLAAVGGYAVWKHYADKGSVPGGLSQGTRPPSGQNGAYSWTIEIDGPFSASDWRAKWSVHWGGKLVDYNSEYANSVNEAYDEARNKVEAVIASGRQPTY